MSHRKFAARCLSGISFAALLATGAQAQDFDFDGIKWGAFVQGGFAYGSHDNGLPYAQFFGPDSTPAISDTFPFTVGSGNGLDIRGGISAHFDNPWSANLVYTGLRTWKHGDTGLFPDFAVVSILPNGLSVDDTGIGSSWNEARVRTSVAADVADFQAGYDVGLGDGFSATLLGGLRYGSFIQKTHVDMLDSSGTVEFVNDRRSYFSGIGPSIGFKASTPTDSNHIGVTGSFIAGFLFGTESSITTGFDSSATPVKTRNLHDARMATTINSDLALTYTLPAGDLPTTTFALGYQVSYYGGVRDTRNGSSGDGTAVYGKTYDSILDYGPFLRVGVNL